MDLKLKEFVVYIRKYASFSLNYTYRFACRHPFVASFIFSLFFLYSYFPSLFSFLVSSSPVLSCTALLLGILLSYGEPNLPEIEEDNRVRRQAFSFNAEGCADGPISKKDESCTSEGFKDSRVQQTKESISKDWAFDYENEIKEEHMSEEILEALMKEQLEFHSRNNVSYNLSEEHGNFIAKTKEPELDWLDCSLGSTWQPIKTHEPSSDSDSDSDAAESSSPDASMADIRPMLDELHPLLDSEAPIRSPKHAAKFDFEHESDDESSRAVMWTADDRKNVMDLGSSDLERNRRLESLISRRRARKNQIIIFEKDLIDFNPQIPSILAPRMNPFDLPLDSDQPSDLPPVPCSAPSVLLSRKNPFDFPCDCKESSYQLELGSPSQRSYFSKRHESFASHWALPKNLTYEKHGFPRLDPYLAAETLLNSDLIDYKGFQGKVSRDEAVNGFSVDSDASAHPEETCKDDESLHPFSSAEHAVHEAMEAESEAVHESKLQNLTASRNEEDLTFSTNTNLLDENILLASMEESAAGEEEHGDVRTAALALNEKKPESVEDLKMQSSFGACPGRPRPGNLELWPMLAEKPEDCKAEEEEHVSIEAFDPSRLQKVAFNDFCINRDFIQRGSNETDSGIDERLLSELDVVCDFQAEELKTEESLHFESRSVVAHSDCTVEDLEFRSLFDEIPSSKPPVSSCSNYSSEELTVYNPKMNVLDACSLEELEPPHSPKSDCKSNDLSVIDALPFEPVNLSTPASSSAGFNTSSRRSEMKGTDSELLVLEANSDEGSALLASPESIEPNQVDEDEEAVQAEAHSNAVLVIPEAELSEVVDSSFDAGLDKPEPEFETQGAMTGLAHEEELEPTAAVSVNANSELLVLEDESVEALTSTISKQETEVYASMMHLVEENESAFQKDIEAMLPKTASHHDHAAQEMSLEADSELEWLEEDPNSSDSPILEAKSLEDLNPAFTGVAKCCLWPDSSEIGVELEAQKASCSPPYDLEPQEVHLRGEVESGDALQLFSVEAKSPEAISSAFKQASKAAASPQESVEFLFLEEKDVEATLVDSKQKETLPTTKRKLLSDSSAVSMQEVTEEDNKKAASDPALSGDINRSADGEDGGSGDPTTNAPFIKKIEKEKKLEKFESTSSSSSSTSSSDSE